MIEKTNSIEYHMAYSFWKRLAALFFIYGLFGWFIEIYIQNLHKLRTGHFLWVYPSSPESATLPVVFIIWGLTALGAPMVYRWFQKQAAYQSATPMNQFAVVFSILGITAILGEFAIARLIKTLTGSHLWIYNDSPIAETAPWILPLWSSIGIILIGIYIEAKRRIFPRIKI